jgi:sodium-dependent phosphate cotransporter
MNTSERVKHVGVVLLKLACLLLVIFTFICTLGLLADAFKLIGGKGIGEAVRNSKIIQNPVSASIVGMVITLILQSSSTLISILVGMVAGGSECHFPFTFSFKKYILPSSHSQQ